MVSNMSVLMDSGFIYACSNIDDVNHLISVDLLKEIEDNKFGSQYITDYIFDETMTLTLSKSSLKKAVEVGNVLFNSYELIPISEILFEEAWGLFQSKKLSFTDCTNIAVMKYFKIEYLATFDRGFKGLVKTIGL